ncbi:hypothetical protein LTR94_024204 [Friedmanniomyces endolithicus]|nr:hypothetical protein LTR94_024204 [Friedmanniomyces endolithicus]
MLRRIAGAFEADRERRRELEQEIFLSVWKAIPKYKGEAPIRAFIARVAHNRAITHVAKEASEPRRSPLDETAPSAEPSPLEAAQDRERRDQLDNAVRALPLALRQPTLLTLEVFTPAQIADILGMNANTTEAQPPGATMTPHDDEWADLSAAWTRPRPDQTRWDAALVRTVERRAALAKLNFAFEIAGALVVAAVMIWALNRGLAPSVAACAFVFALFAVLMTLWSRRGDPGLLTDTPEAVLMSAIGQARIGYRWALSGIAISLAGMAFIIAMVQLEPSDAHPKGSLLTASLGVLIICIGFYARHALRSRRRLKAHQDALEALNASERFNLRLIRAPFKHDQSARFKPAAFDQALERLLSEAFAIGWIQEGQIKSLPRRPWPHSEVNRTASVDPCLAEKTKGFGILSDRATRTVIGFDKEAEDSATTNRLKAKGPRARVQINDASLGKSLPPRSVLKDIEQSLASAI